MASSFTTTALQVNFDSVLGNADNAEMVNMFKALESTGLRRFLGCPSVLYEQELEQFFDTDLVQDNNITGVVSGKYIAITEDRFAGVFGLTTEGLVDISEVPKDLVYDARRIFSKSGEPVSTSCKKRLLKYEFLILAKSITVNAGSFDAVIHERFLMMTAIHFRIKVNWSKILFGVLKDMVDKTLERAKGFAAQICVLLKGDPAVTLGDATTFPSLKIISAKTVQTYVATNETIDTRGKSDESRVVKVASVKNKSVHKKKYAPTVDETTVAAPSKDNLELVTVAQEVVPLQTIEQISAVPAEREAVEETVAEREIEISFDTIDQIIEQILADIELFEMGEELETDMGDQGLVDVGEQMETGQDAYFVEEPMVETESLEGTEIADAVLTTAEKSTDDESMSLEEILSTISDGCSLPSISGEVTKIQLGKNIQFKDFNEGDWYKASLPKISTAEKGKAPLHEKDPIKGNPTKGIFALICADIDLLVQLREQVIDEVDRFFNSFSFKKLAALKLEEIFAKEELVLTWAETDSTKVALQRRTYILLKYREFLLRRFLETRQSNFVSGTPSSAIDLQVLDKLSDLHLFVLEELKVQIQAHGLSLAAQDQAFRGLIKNIRQEAHNDTDVLSIALKVVHAQNSILSTDIADVRKEVKDQKELFKEMDEQLATVRSELLDFRAQAQENNLNLSTQLGFLVDYINRGGDAKKGEGGSSRPQPPPDDQNRPSGGSASRGSGSGGISRRDDRILQTKGDPAVVVVDRVLAVNLMDLMDLTREMLNGGFSSISVVNSIYSVTSDLSISEVVTELSEYIRFEVVRSV
ncbi:hypothetical protein F511_23445 [Dorcoceras hygrometricum]|uniref:Dystroglycan-like n=1 Tax=Dorcoceras hygrometricum TaxID=472368 RepID=A0A2Z7CXA2_9LAMI|nr:hypothetical protein F511_23445 [Dorcoceras hygrometricum]